MVPLMAIADAMLAACGHATEVHQAIAAQRLAGVPAEDVVYIVERTVPAYYAPDIVDGVYFIYEMPESAIDRRIHENHNLCVENATRELEEMARRTRAR